MARYLRRVAVLFVLVLVAATTSFVAVATDDRAATAMPSDWRRLNIVGRAFGPADGLGDHLSKPDDAPPPPGGVDEGIMWYISSDSADGPPLYRLYKHTPVYDHMDSSFPGEAGYTTEQHLGHVYGSQLDGMCPIRRHYSASATNHMTGFCNESAPGYAVEGTFGYGYARHGTLAEVPYTKTVGPVSVTLNQAAGGIVSELRWNGKQFLNKWDYGRELQLAGYPYAGCTPTCENPTEGGDWLGAPGPVWSGWVKSGYQHGSPMLALTDTPLTLSTRTAPLDWNPSTTVGDSGHPSLWTGRFAKTMTFNVLNLPRLMRWDTAVTFPSASPGIDFEVPTAYLNAEFSRAFTYRSGQVALTPLAMPAHGAPPFVVYQGQTSPETVAIVLATPSCSHALAIYRRGAPGNTIFSVLNFDPAGGGSGEYDGDTYKINTRIGGPVSAGQRLDVTSYISVGTCNDVVADLQVLSLLGL